MDAYIYQSDLYCPTCANKRRLELDADYPSSLQGIEYDSDKYPQGPFPDGGGEADSFQYCAQCRVFLGNELTVDGIQYEVEHLPDIEMLRMTSENITDAGPESCWYDDEGEPLQPGYYYRYCTPGCLPDSDPYGPYPDYAILCQHIIDENWPEEGATY